MRKEPFWLFKTAQRKISKNTLQRAKFLALSGEPIKWLFKEVFDGRHKINLKQSYQEAIGKPDMIGNGEPMQFLDKGIKVIFHRDKWIKFN